MKTAQSLIPFLICLFLMPIWNSALAFENEIKKLSYEMATKISKLDKKTIAVLDFTDLQGNVTELGRFLAEEFSVSLLQSGKKFEVIDRTHLKSLLTEHNLLMVGLMDPKTAPKIGKVVGAQALITGTVTPLDDSVRINVKVLDSTTARVIGACQGNIQKTKDIESLLAKGPFRQEGVTLEPVIAIGKSGKGSNMILRSTPLLSLDEGSVRSMLSHYGFFDKKRNPGGQFKNSFQAKLLGGYGVVIDKATGLMWQQGGTQEKLEFHLAVSYPDKINKEKFAGFSDWRLPTIEELASLLSPEKSGSYPYEKYINKIFDLRLEWLLSSDFVSQETSWYCHLGWGELFASWLRNNPNCYVRAVRTIK